MVRSRKMRRNRRERPLDLKGTETIETSDGYHRMCNRRGGNEVLWAREKEEHEVEFVDPSRT